MPSFLHVSFEVTSNDRHVAGSQMDRIWSEVVKIRVPGLRAIEEETRVYGCEVRRVNLEYDEEDYDAD